MEDSKKIKDMIAAIGSTDGWSPKMRDNNQRPLSLGPHTLFFVFRSDVMVDSSVIMGHFEKTNDGMLWSAMSQFFLFVLKLAFMQLGEIETPPGDYPIQAYLVPLRAQNNDVVEYMLVINASDDSPVKLDPLFVESAKSQSKQCNIKGHLLDVVDPKKRAATVYHERKDTSEFKLETDAKEFVDYKYINTIKKLDILFSVYAKRTLAVSSSQSSAQTVFSLANAIWNMSPLVSDRYRRIERYKRPGDQFGLPTDSVYYEIDSRFCTPDGFLHQIMPHLLTSEYENRFKINLLDLARKTSDKIKSKATPALGSSGVEAEIENEGLNNMVSYSQYRVPDWAVGEDARQALGLFRTKTAEVAHENHVLVSLRHSMIQTRKIIEDAYTSGAITEEERGQWMYEANKSIIKKYERTCCHSHSEVSDIARAYHQFNEEKKTNAKNMDLVISDPTLSAMANFKIYLMEVLTQYLGVAVHQPVIADMYILSNSMFSGNPANAVFMGEGGAGKSYNVEQLFEMIGKFAVNANDSQSMGRHWISQRFYYGVKYSDEMDPSSTVNNGNNQIGEAKALASRGYVVREALARDEKTGERSIDKLLYVQKCMVVGSMNKDESALLGSIKLSEETSMAAFLTRFFIFNIPTVNHDLRDIAHVRAGMDKKLSRPKEDVLNELISLHARSMILQELMYITVLDKIDMNQYHKCFAKFDNIMKQIQIKSSANNRQSVKVEQSVACHVITRVFLEYYCIPGVSPFHGKPFDLMSLLSVPLICTLEDVIMGCTMCYSMYMPRDVATVSKTVRKIVLDLIKQDGGEISFKNPNTSTAAHAPTFRPVDPGVASGLLPRMDDRPNMEAYRNPGQMGIPTEERPATYVCINGMKYEKFSNIIYNAAYSTVIRPSVMSTKTCVNILKAMMIPGPKYVWAPGYELPRPIEHGDSTQIFSKPALDFAENSTFVHVKLLEENTGTFEDTWENAIRAMFDEGTIPRRALTSMTYHDHPFITRSIDIQPNLETPSLMLNPRHISEASEIALTGRYNPNGNPINRNEILEIKTDSDIYFSIQYYIRKNSNAPLGDAMKFATFNHPVNKIAMTKKALEEILDEETDRQFRIYPDSRIEELNRLKKANDFIRAGKRPEGVEIVTSNEILRQMCRNEEDKARVDQYIDVHKQIMDKVAESATQDGASMNMEEFSSILGVEKEGIVRMKDLIKEAHDKFNPIAHKQSILADIEEEEEEEPEDRHIEPPPRIAHPERDAFDEDGEDEGAEEDEEEEDEPIIEYPDPKRRRVSEDEDD